MKEEGSKIEVFCKTCEELSSENREKLLVTAEGLLERQREDEALFDRG